MKRFAKSFLSLLLILSLLLPLLPARAANSEGRPITVTAQDLFSERSLLTEILVKDGQCYIKPEQAALLAGLGYKTSGGMLFFINSFTDSRISAHPEDIPHLSWQQSTYYELEKMMDFLEVWIGVSEEGILYFSSLPYNMITLGEEIRSVLDDSRYDADRLHSTWLTGALYTVGNIYDIITNLRVNALWGGSRKEDYASLLLKLVQSPDLEGEDISKALKKKNKAYGLALDTMTYFLSKLDLDSENWDDWADYFNEIFSDNTGWQILTGLRNSDEFIQSINDGRKLDLADLFFRSDIQKLTKEAGTEYGLKLPSSLSVFDLGDILDLSSYYFSLFQAEGAFIQALETVLEDSPSQEMPVTAEEIWFASQKGLIRMAADPLIEDYHAVFRDDHFWLSLGKNIGETVSENIVTGTIKKLSFTSPELLTLKIAGFLLDRFEKTKEKVTAIREMVLNIQIQEFLRQYLESKLKTLQAADAGGLIGAAELYLNAAKNSVKLFSYEALGKKHGIPTKTAEDTIDKALAVFLEYSDYQFRFAAPNEPVDAGRLKDQSRLIKSFSAASWQVETVYADSGAFLCDSLISDSPILYSYCLPKLIGSEPAAAEFNQHAARFFEPYIQAQGSRVRYLTDEINASYSDLLPYADIADNCNGMVLTDVNWEAASQGSLLSIRLFGTCTNLWNGYEEPQLYAFTLDTANGKELSTEEILHRVGLTKEGYWERLKGAMAALTESPEALQSTLSEAQQQLDKENWLYLNEQGLPESVFWMNNGSAHGCWEIIAVDPKAEPVSADTFMEQGRKQEAAARQKAKEAWKAQSSPSVEDMLLCQTFSPESLLSKEEWFLKEIFEDQWLLLEAFLPDTVSAGRSELESALTAYENAVSAGGGTEAEEAVKRVRSALLLGCPSRADMEYHYEDGDIGFFHAVYRYDEMGRPTEIVIEKEDETGGLRINYCYDAQGRETGFSVTSSDGYQLYIREKTYDSAGHITALTLGSPDDADMILSFAWDYDAEGRILAARPKEASESFFGAFTISYLWDGAEFKELSVTSFYGQEVLEERIVMVRSTEDELLRIQGDGYADDEFIMTLPLMDVSFHEDGTIDHFDCGRDLILSELGGDESHLFFTYDENGTVESTYVWHTYFEGAAEDSTDCRFDPYGRYTRHVWGYWQEADAGYFEENEGSLGLYYQFNENGLRTEALYKVNDVPVAVFHYSY